MENKKKAPPARKKVPLKKRIERRFDNYLENRRKKLSENDVVFSESLDRESPKNTVLAKGSIDKWFLLIVMFLLVFGAIMSFSASSVYAANKYGDSAFFFKKYVGYAMISILVFTPLVIFMTPRWWKLIGLAMYAGTAVLLLLVLIIGDTGGGAQRWIDLGFITIQPSEFAKVAIVMVLALYLEKHEKQVNSLQKFGGHFKHGFFMPMVFIT